jgi:hypothetical protein
MTVLIPDFIDEARRLKRLGLPDAIVVNEIRGQGCSRSAARDIVSGVSRERYAARVFGRIKEKLRGPHE